VPEETHLLELVLRWEELRDSGEAATPEQLCAECPELLPRLRERIEALKAMNAVLTGGETASYAIGPETTVPRSSAEMTADGVLAQGVKGYEILSQLGRGGMGVVFLARQTALKRRVALKMLLAGPYAAPAERARFEAEVEAIARLQHPNLVQVYEVGEQDGRAFFAMEYVDGGNLHDKIKAQPQPARQAAQMVEFLARAMQVAHEHGVIHRDLKPANILLTADGTPKISDFGLAKRLDVAGGTTLTAHILGTPGYMAPEQAMGHSKQVGPGTDVYALGAILYEMLTGRPPFTGTNAMEVVRQAAEEEPVPPRRLESTVPADLETICLKCLRKQPLQRYSSARDLADDLSRFLKHEPILARPVGPLQMLAKWARRRPAVAALIAVSGLALLTALAGGIWFTNALSAELKRTRQARHDAVVAQHELETTLAREVAAQLDADLRQLEIVPQSMAELLALREQWPEQELEAWTRALVKKDKRVFGICIAFEPGQFVGTRRHEDYCLYVHEQGDGLATKQLLPPNYPPPFYRERDWYTDAKEMKAPSWNEPYKAQGADNTPMVTYSVPFFRSGKFSGVVTADLSIQYFRSLHNLLQGQSLGPDSYSFVISPKGTFIYHPDLKYEFPGPASSLQQIRAAPDFLDLVQQMRNKDAGRARATDFRTGQPATFYFARIPATGWQFVVVHPAGNEQDEK
jgi:predicted Ser/Thr protein kinase